MTSISKKKKKLDNKKDELSTLKNVGPATRRDFQLLGIESIEQLAKQNADQLYERLSSMSEDRVDPCVHDVFSATIYQAQTGEALPWWKFSASRNQRNNH